MCTFALYGETPCSPSVDPGRPREGLPGAFDALARLEWELALPLDVRRLFASHPPNPVDTPGLDIRLCSGRIFERAFRLADTESVEFESGAPRARVRTGPYWALRDAYAGYLRFSGQRHTCAFRHGR